jgi:serine protease Do
MPTFRSITRHRPVSRAGSSFVNCTRLIAIACLTVCLAPTLWAADLSETIDSVQPKLVKIHGAGGFRGLEAYQSGFLISPDGHVLTAWSYVLDAREIAVTLHDGRRLIGELLAADPEHELAVLKIDATDLPCFDLASPYLAGPGQRVLAFSNLFGVATGDEQASVQHGIVAIVAPLAARRGAFEIPYHGPVYILDAPTNNPGAAGGALTDWQGNLLGILGKEIKSRDNDLWLNYALPLAEVAPVIEQLRAGQSPQRMDLAAKQRREDIIPPLRLGLVLVPDVVDRTPPYVDDVRPESAAARAGLQPDDLVVAVQGQLVASLKAFRDQWETLDFTRPIALTVNRGSQLVELTLSTEGVE